MQANQTGTKTPAYSSSSRWAARGLFLATLVALPFTLAACSTQTSQPPAPLPMPTVNTATTSAAATEPATEDSQATPVPSTGVASETPLLPEQIQPPVPSEVALENSADGAEAYAHFLFQAWWYLINTHDIHWWDTNIPNCEWKTQMRETADQNIAEDLRTQTEKSIPFTVSRKVNPANTDEYAITLNAEMGAIYGVDANGIKTVLSEAVTNKMAAVLRYTDNGWEILAVDNDEVDQPK